MRHMSLMFKAGISACLLLGAASVLSASAGEKAAQVKEGDKAPDFSLPDQDGNMRSLKDFIGKKSVVLYFYPKDDIGVCLKEACLFRDDYRQFTNAGAEVVGVSDDSVDEHKKFVKHRNLPFVLLSDRKGKVRKLYGVPDEFGGLLPARVTFVIDPKGTVRLSFNNFMHADQHVAQALNVLKKIDQKQPSTATE